jgi:hypothetical protein
MTRCRSAEVERVGKVTVEWCRYVRLRGVGAASTAGCRRADLEIFDGV